MRVCRVVLDHRALDRALDYTVPLDLAGQTEVGSIVRVPLQGRRVRGWVVADDVEPETPRDRLRSVLSVVSLGPSPELVDLTKWAAWRWAGPRPVFLRAASPALLVPPSAAGALDNAGPFDRALESSHLDRSPASAEARDLARGSATSPNAVLRWPPSIGVDEILETLVDVDDRHAGGSCIVIAPSARDCARHVEHLRSRGLTAVTMRADQSPRLRTAAWMRARRGNCVVVGGRLAAWAPLPDLYRIVVFDDLDESLQEERAPIWHARELCVERAHRSKAKLTVVSPVPSLESTERAMHVFAPSRSTERAGWPVIDVVDRREESTTPGVFSSELARSIRRTLERATVPGGNRVLCVLNRRGRARLLACRECQNIVRCENCGAAGAEDPSADPVELVCPRCSQRWPRLCTGCGGMRLSVLRAGITQIARELAALTRAEVGEVDTASEVVPDAPVLVGTEAVLHRVERAGLVAFLDFDQELFAPRYRAGEQALWLLVRAARVVGPRGDGGHILIQTRTPHHEVIQAALHAEPDLFLLPEREQRLELGLPPFGAVAQLTGSDAALDSVRTALGNAALLDGGSAYQGVSVGGHSGSELSVRATDSELLANALARVLPAARSVGRLRVLVDPPRSF